MSEFWFTWGSGQKYPNVYTVVEARNIMFARAGRRWSMMYDSAEDCGVEKYNLGCIPVESLRLPSDMDFLQMLNELLDLENGLTDAEIHRLDMTYSHWDYRRTFTWEQRAFIRMTHEYRIP